MNNKYSIVNESFVINKNNDRLEYVKNETGEIVIIKKLVLSMIIKPVKNWLIMIIRLLEKKQAHVLLIKNLVFNKME